MKESIIAIINKLNGEGFRKEDWPLVLKYLEYINNNNFDDYLYDLEDTINQIERLKLPANELNAYFLGIIKSATIFYIKLKRKEMLEESVKNEVQEMKQEELIDLIDITALIENSGCLDIKSISKSIDINEIILLQLINKYNYYFYTKKTDGMIYYYLSEKGVYLSNYFKLINTAYSLLKKKS